MHTIGKEECEICHIKFTRTSLKLHEREAHPELVDDSVPDEVQLKNFITVQPDNEQQNDEVTEKSFCCKLLTETY